MAQVAQMSNGPPDGNDEKPGIDGEELKKKSKQGGPRKRVSQACDKCRSRKDKCDGKKPACSTCIANGRECSYDANVKKRGLPEGYVRGLEKLWGLAIRDVDEVEDNILSALAGDDESTDSPLTIWNDESNSEALVELWRKSIISRELEKLLSSQEPTETKRKRINSEGQGFKSNENHAFQRSSVSTSQPVVNQEPDYASTGWSDRVPDVMTQTDFRTPPNTSAIDPTFLPKEYESILSPYPGHAAPSHGTPAAVPDVLPDLPSETWHLLDVYFSYTHSWLPIIEKHDLLKSSYQYSQNRGESTSAGSGDNAVLWAAIAYAKFQHRAINNIPRALGAVGEMVWTAERMYAQARSLIPNEEGNLELGHVQALLILSLANLGMGHFSRAWSLIGHAVRVAIDMQLDRPLASESRAKSRFKHVFLGCFALETLIAARLNRRPHLRAEDADIAGLLDEDGLEEWDPWTDCLSVRKSSSGNSRMPASILSTFNQLVQVLKILNDACSCSIESNTLQFSTVLLQKLHIWSQSQSPPLYFDSTAKGSEQALSLLPHQYHLHNVYFTTLATSQLLSNNNGQEEVNLEPCTRSARQTVDLLNQHSNIFGLLIVPPTYEYFVKSAYDIVHAVHSSIESTHIVLNDWKRGLDNCLDIMEPAWPVFEAFKSSTAYQSTVRATRSHSQAAYDLIMDQDSDTPMSGKTPQSLASYDAFDPFSPQNSRAPAEALRPRGVSQLRSNRPSFGQSSGHGLPQNPRNIYEDVHATIGSAKRHPSNKQNNRQLPAKPPHVMAPQSSFNINQPTNPQLHRSLTMSSADVEFDPMFNELMRLDATEWAGNWDQSLMNLGFTDTDNMNQDFYAFCQEPDPLHQNTVFQQLVANSNAETNDFFDGSGFNGSMRLVPGGFTGVGVGMADENEGIEAGQILQALSAAEDQRGKG
ncbi:fungal-specific transcription factor domain-containing protein [Cadophora sp. MPI-SDFR-AT-0126]|nr:fungal-specific transcription factor domain-containing protein [Leotiomycetes sp. MPI-SDFR-AT-0126]